MGGHEYDQKFPPTANKTISSMRFAFPQFRFLYSSNI